MNGILALKRAKTYTDESLKGGGAVAGKNVTISSITPIDGGNRVTFSYILDDGTSKTSTMDVMDGVDGVTPVKGVDYFDGTNGQDGVGISQIEKISTVGLVDTYRITFSDNTTFDYEVTNGADGTGGTGSGEENIIESIKVNGVAQTVADDKSVDIAVPSIKGLATEGYVDNKLGDYALSFSVDNEKLSISYGNF